VKSERFDCDVRGFVFSLTTALCIGYGIAIWYWSFIKVQPYVKSSYFVVNDYLGMLYCDTCNGTSSFALWRISWTCTVYADFMFSSLS